MQLERKTQPQLQVDLISGPQNEEKYSALLDRAFQVPAGMRFLDDFPIWSGRFHQGSVFRVGVFQEDVLVGAVGIRFANLKTSTAEALSVALIGSVAIDENWRGHGIASQVVLLAVDWAREKGAALVILWGSEHDLYRRLGFELCGEQLRFPLRQFSDLETKAEVHTGWNPQILSLMRQRRNGVELSDEDRALIEAHRNVRWYWTGERDQPTAYAALGRGIDLAHLVHEWGGDSASLRKVLSRIHQEDSDAEILGHPDLLRDHGILGGGPTEFLCLARILDPEVLLRAYHPELMVKAMPIDGGWSLAVDGELYPELTESELVRLIFGPRAENSVSPFHVPLWVWGLDAG